MKLNRQEADILVALYENPGSNQRTLAQLTNYSLGKVNQAYNQLIELGYINQEKQITQKGIRIIKNAKSENAIILAAGCGMRMVPINLMTPKGLLDVHGEPLIERIIKQLHEVGVHNIYIVVGFMKESFEYLIDEYDVRLIVNPNYMIKNNLYSLSLADMVKGNTYIIPSDLYCVNNPFQTYELYSWYMISDQKTHQSNIRVNNKYEFNLIKSSEKGNRMIGITYLTKADTKIAFDRIQKMKTDSQYDQSFFEDALFEKDHIIPQAKIINDQEVIEINTFEQLLELDKNSKQLDNTAISIIKDLFHVDASEIKNIEMLKKGMTNRSFFFSVNNKKYIMRIPGEGTDQLINRKEEANVYQIISKTGICDPLIYINPENGYKITEYLEHSRVCDQNCKDDVSACMKTLRNFHQMKLQSDHDFDVFNLIEFYESLWNGKKSAYRDYLEVKQNIMSLQDFINKHKKPFCLCHIDSVPDNFLFYQKEKQEKIALIDWEYAGNQDPDIDIAMFAIYSLYSKEQVDQLIDLYYENQCDEVIRVKIYCYIAICGLLWSNWCEYKRNLGVEFGEYSLAQYRFAKDYFRYATNSKYYK